MNKTNETLINKLLAAKAIPILPDLGPKDLIQKKMLNVFPKVGTIFESYCGPIEKGENCKIENSK